MAIVLHMTNLGADPHRDQAPEVAASGRLKEPGIVRGGSNVGLDDRFELRCLAIGGIGEAF